MLAHFFSYHNKYNGHELDHHQYKQKCSFQSNRYNVASYRKKYFVSPSIEFIYYFNTFNILLLLTYIINSAFYNYTGFATLCRKAGQKSKKFKI